MTPGDAVLAALLAHLRTELRPDRRSFIARAMILATAEPRPEEPPGEERALLVAEAALFLGSEDDPDVLALVLEALRRVPRLASDRPFIAAVRGLIANTDPRVLRETAGALSDAAVAGDRLAFEALWDMARGASTRDLAILPLLHVASAPGVHPVHREEVRRWVPGALASIDLESHPYGEEIRRLSTSFDPSAAAGEPPPELVQLMRDVAGAR